MRQYKLKNLKESFFAVNLPHYKAKSTPLRRAFLTMPCSDDISRFARTYLVSLL